MKNFAGRPTDDDLACAAIDAYRDFGASKQGTLYAVDRVSLLLKHFDYGEMRITGDQGDLRSGAVRKAWTGRYRH